MAITITITFGSLKGGVGKTSVATNVAAAWATKSKRVLLVDADPQGSATNLFVDDPDEIADRSLGDVLTANGKATVELADVIVETAVDGLHLVPAVYDILEPVERMDPMKAMRSIKKALKAVQGEYDLIVIDTPPRLSLLTDAAVIAADYAVAVTPPSAIDNSGADRFASRVEELAEDMSDAEVVGWVGNKWALDSAEARLIAEIAEEAEWPLLDPVLPVTKRLGKAFLEAGTPAVIAYPSAPYSIAVRSLADALLKRVSS